MVVLEKDEEGQENLHEDGQGQGGDRGAYPAPAAEAGPPLTSKNLACPMGGNGREVHR